MFYNILLIFVSASVLGHLHGANKFFFGMYGLYVNLFANYVDK